MIKLYDGLTVTDIPIDTLGTYYSINMEQIERINSMIETCTDNRFEIISKAKQALLESTNIDTSPNEMKVVDDFLFRCWQMGWLDKYDDKGK